MQTEHASQARPTTKTVYTYVLDTMADWELGHVLAELNSRRFFRKDAPHLDLFHVGATREPVVSMGGFLVTPELAVEDVVVGADTLLLLPGADTWSDPRHRAIVDKARDVLDAGGTVAAICGATVALAAAGLLDDRSHTSNGAGFLEMFVPSYQGTSHYVEARSVADGNLITAGSTGELLWAKHIIERLGVMDDAALQAWYGYFSTGEARYFFALMDAAGR